MELSAKMEMLNYVGDTFNIGSIYKQIYTATNLLSSYWVKQEVTIQYPINFVSDVNSNITNFYIDNLTSDSTLIEVARNYLNQNFPARNHYKNFIMNISFLLYSSIGNFSQSVTDYGRYNPISNYWGVAFRKDDVYITRSRNIKFKNISDTWVFMGTI